VLQWQEETRQYARDHGYVNTMLGRRRNLRPAINSPRAFERSRAERAAINTPIQGSAADVAAAAMLAIARDEWLREHGWRLLLQVRCCRRHRGRAGTSLQLCLPDFSLAHASAPFQPPLEPVA
jgi:DNA polymerase I-like protein with 3'-5' exonuclease and polymerase domains